MKLLPSLVPPSTQPLKAELPKGSYAVLCTPRLEGSDEELLFPLELEMRVEVVRLWLVMLEAVSWQGSATNSDRGFSVPTMQTVPVGSCPRAGEVPSSAVLALGFYWIAVCRGGHFVSQPFTKVYSVLGIPTNADGEESSDYFWDTQGEQLSKKRNCRSDEFPDNVTWCSVCCRILLRLVWRYFL